MGRCHPPKGAWVLTVGPEPGFTLDLGTWSKETVDRGELLREVCAVVKGVIWGSVTEDRRGSRSPPCGAGREQNVEARASVAQLRLSGEWVRMV